MNGQRMFVVYDEVHFSTEYYDGGDVEVFHTPEAALLAVNQNNDKFNGLMPGPDGTLIKARPWKAYELVEVKHDGAGKTGPG